MNEMGKALDRKPLVTFYNSKWHVGEKGGEREKRKTRRKLIYVVNHQKPKPEERRDNPEK